MRADYKKWLEEQKYKPNVINARIANARSVEKAYGDLSDHFNRDKLQGVLKDFGYSAEDERRNKPNPSKIKINGDLRTGLATLKSAVGLYRKFLESGLSSLGPRGGVPPPPEPGDPIGSKLSLERDMQAALRSGSSIKKLGSSLTICDDGTERLVESGLIDITCEDSVDGALVVVELKAGKADGKAIGQITGYMGDLVAEEDGRTIRGILVAHEFDNRATSAARIIPGLVLMSYSVEFKFEPHVERVEQTK